MNELPILKEIAQVPGLLKEIYGDLAKPGVMQVGKAIGALLGLGNTILWRVTLLNERTRIALDRNLEKYRAQLEEIPEEKVIPVPPELGVPVLEKLAYVTNDELSDLYINLLAKASTTEFANVAHPAFANIINHLCPDEALLLQPIDESHAFIDATVESKNMDRRWRRTASPLLTGFERKVALSYPDNIVVYLSNFEGLGLIRIRRDCSLFDETPYSDLIGFYRPPVEAKLSYDKETEELTFLRGWLEVTNFGRLFRSACLHKLKG